MARLVPTLLAAGCLGLAGCQGLERPADDRVVRGGDPARGRAIVASGQYGCTACHAIPGTAGVQGIVGPPLHGFAGRIFVAGELPNTPRVLTAFLEDPPALVPQSGMPDVGLSPEEARHVAAYLYTLEATGAR